jgi:phenylalanyl-tRNA synthetase beta chain
MLAAVVAGSVNRSGWWGKADPYIWSDAIGQVREMLELAGAEYEIHASDLAPWHPGRCAEFRVNNIPVAHAGELHPRVCREYGLPVGSTAFGILINAFDYQEPTRVRPVWAMPASTQDISLFVNSDVAASAVERALRDGAGELLESITLFDRFVKKGEEDKTSLAFTLTFRAPDRTLTAEEVSGYRQAAGEAAAAACGAVIRTE